jgi:hypothetical protein
MLDRMGEFAQWRGDLHLAFLLEAAHGVLVGGRGTTDHDRRPAILLRVAQAG